MSAAHDDHIYQNETGVIRNKKTYFAILAHINEEALSAQVQNIRHYNPDAGIIVYNGGTDPGLGRRLNVLLYPESHPIRYGNLTPYFWEIMKWLEDNNMEYEYLINLDHDVLFVQHGFQDYLDKIMVDYDVMGWHMVTTFSPADTDLTCCHDMWKEWALWGPFFETGYFIRYLNSTQVYRHGIIRKMLKSAEHRGVEDMIGNSNVFALEEMFFVTLALSLGARIREYPRDENWNSVARFGLDQISMEEVRLIQHHPYYYWIHPVKEAWLIRMNRVLLGMEEWEAPVNNPSMPEVDTVAVPADPPPSPPPPTRNRSKIKYSKKKIRPRRKPASGKSGKRNVYRLRKKIVKKKAAVLKTVSKGKKNKSIQTHKPPYLKLPAL